MKYCMQWLLGLAFLLAGCNETDKKPGESSGTKEAARDSPTLQVDTAIHPQSKPENGEYCFITHVYDGEGVNYLDADYIQFLMGDQAAEAARKRGDALWDINKKGDTVYSVPNGYYIVNENTKIRKLTLAPDFVYIPLEMDGHAGDIKGDALSVLKSRIKGHLFILTLKDDVVTRIKEQYIP